MHAEGDVIHLLLHACCLYQIKTRLYASVFTLRSLMCLDFQNQLHGSKLLASLKVTLQRGDRLTIGQLQILDVGILGLLDDDAMDVVVMVYHHDAVCGDVYIKLASPNISLLGILHGSDRILGCTRTVPIAAMGYHLYLSHGGRCQQHHSAQYHTSLLHILLKKTSNNV